MKHKKEMRDHITYTGESALRGLLWAIPVKVMLDVLVYSLLIALMHNGTLPSASPLIKAITIGTITTSLVGVAAKKAQERREIIKWQKEHKPA